MIKGGDDKRHLMRAADSVSPIQTVCAYCGQSEGHSKRCSVTKFGADEMKMSGVGGVEAGVAQTGGERPGASPVTSASAAQAVVEQRSSKPPVPGTNPGSRFDSASGPRASKVTSAEELPWCTVCREQRTSNHDGRCINCFTDDEPRSSEASHVYYDRLRDGVRVRVTSGPNEGRRGGVYDSVQGESKVQLDGDIAGSWYSNRMLEVINGSAPRSNEAQPTLEQLAHYVTSEAVVSGTEMSSNVRMAIDAMAAKLRGEPNVFHPKAKPSGSVHRAYHLQVVEKLQTEIDSLKNEQRPDKALPADLASARDPESNVFRGIAGRITIGDMAGDGTGPWRLFLGECGVATWPSKAADEDPRGYAASVARTVQNALADRKHGPVVEQRVDYPKGGALGEIERMIQTEDWPEAHVALRELARRLGGT